MSTSLDAVATASPEVDARPSGRRMRSVLPGWQCRGLGRRLATTSLVWAEARGVTDHRVECPSRTAQARPRRAAAPSFSRGPTP